MYFHYHQPKEYRFSLDSIELARASAKIINESKNIIEGPILDLCAGCGVVGLELQSLLTNGPWPMDFLEIQEAEYRPCLEKNVAELYPSLPFNFFNFYFINYNSSEGPYPYKKYSFIVSNPPYFRPNEGILSPSQFKNRCRFFIDSDFDHFLHFIAQHLSVNGMALFLMKEGQEYGRQLKNLSHPKLNFELHQNIRGTLLIRAVLKV